MNQTPDLALVRALPVRLRTTVTDDFIDVNGHMNITQYLRIGAEALELAQIAAGMDEHYRGGRRMSTFAVEHHLTYRAEMHLGEELSAHPQLLDRDERTYHAMIYLVNDTNDRLANTLEAVLVHVDMDTRRAHPFPPDVAAALDQMVATQSTVLPAPTSGAMGIRR